MKVDQFLLEANEYLKGKTFDWEINKQLVGKVLDLRDDPKTKPGQKDKIKEVSEKINDIYVKYYIENADRNRLTYHTTLYHGAP